MDKGFEKKVIEHERYIKEVKKEISKVVVGQEHIINGLLIAIFANGSVLLEGVPGIAKTLMVRTLSQIMGCKFSRIQFTPDLLPTDIIGITTYEKERGFYVLKGPIFANFILADEINRAPPKVQSALLEVMQEKQVTIGRETFPVVPPFFVLATQNPIESAGTYSLPEAQIDRFLFKLLINYPNIDDEQKILLQNITIKKFESFELKQLSSASKIIEIQEDTKKIYLDPKIEKYIVKVVDATRNPGKYNVKLGHYIQWGCSPRASIGLFIGAKSNALIHGKAFVTPYNVKEVAYDVLRHRILLNYEGQSEGITSDQIVSEILSKIPVP